MKSENLLRSIRIKVLAFEFTISMNCKIECYHTFENLR